MPDLVCDTSPLQYLHQTGLLYLLRELVQTVCVPPTVESELDIARRYGIDLPQLQNTEWIHVVNPQGAKAGRLLSDMGHGEAEVLMLALERESFVAVIDDYVARKRASLLNISFTGTLGILLDAKKLGLILKINPVLDKLEALQFRLSPSTRQMVLRKAEELF